MTGVVFLIGEQDGRFGWGLPTSKSKHQASKSSKHQTPSSREHPSIKLQKPRPLVWYLKVCASLELGAWCLVLLIPSFHFKVAEWPGMNNV
jgi:hypothetical protein